MPRCYLLKLHLRFLGEEFWESGREIAVVMFGVVTSLSNLLNPTLQSEGVAKTFEDWDWLEATVAEMKMAKVMIQYADNRTLKLMVASYSALDEVFFLQVKDTYRSRPTEVSLTSNYRHIHE